MNWNWQLFSEQGEKRMGRFVATRKQEDLIKLIASKFRDLVVFNRNASFDWTETKENWNKGFEFIDGIFI